MKLFTSLMYRPGKIFKATSMAQYIAYKNPREQELWSDQTRRENTKIQRYGLLGCAGV
jgi:hypothetical protein